jgi:sugar-phosphatase
MKALIFDMDGVLVDSEPLWRMAEREVFADIGLELTDADCEMTMGTRSDEVIAYWFQRSPWTGPSPAEVEERLENRMRELLTERAVAMPGVHQAVAMARRLGLHIALASSSSPRLIEAVLAKLELEEVFEVARSAIHEARGKPHPGVFLSTARQLGVEPAECVVIEDSIAGVEAGRRAGMRVIAVPPAHFFDRPEYKVADFKLRSLCELTEEMLR